MRRCGKTSKARLSTLSFDAGPLNRKENDEKKRQAVT
jgi:hypothetical protein